MQISSNYIAGDWKKLSFDLEDDWQTGIDIFTDRIKERFLDPIKHIDKFAFAGFAVMALDCLLIEMLQQFRAGVYRTPANRSKDFFVDFLTTTSYNEYFDNRKAVLFYRQIRCGILHQAELRGSSKISTSGELVIYADDSQGLIVNRLKFHDHLLTVFDQYVDSIRDKSNIETREKFITKMKSICKTACEII